MAWPPALTDSDLWKCYWYPVRCSPLQNCACLQCCVARGVTSIQYLFFILVSKVTGISPDSHILFRILRIADDRTQKSLFQNCRSRLVLQIGKLSIFTSERLCLSKMLLSYPVMLLICCQWTSLAAKSSFSCFLSAPLALPIISGASPNLFGSVLCCQIKMLLILLMT